MVHQRMGRIDAPRLVLFNCRPVFVEESPGIRTHQGRSRTHGTPILFELMLPVGQLAAAPISAVAWRLPVGQQDVPSISACEKLPPMGWQKANWTRCLASLCFGVPARVVCALAALRNRRARQQLGTGRGESVVLPMRELLRHKWVALLAVLSLPYFMHLCVVVFPQKH